jgi:hypothetical protein
MALIWVGVEERPGGVEGVARERAETSCSEETEGDPSRWDEDGRERAGGEEERQEATDDPGAGRAFGDDIQNIRR